MDYLFVTCPCNNLYRAKRTRRHLRTPESQSHPGKGPPMEASRLFGGLSLRVSDHFISIAAPQADVGSQDHWPSKDIV